MMNPLYRPHPGRASVDDKNATVEDLATALVAIGERAKAFDDIGGEAEAKALIGVVERYRKILAKFEKHAASELRALLSKQGRIINDPMQARLPSAPRSLRSLQQGR